MPLIQLLVLIVVVGVVLWAINSFIPMQRTIKTILNVVVIVVLIVVILDAFGIVDLLPGWRLQM